MAAAGKIHLRGVLAGANFLLDLPLWFHDLFGLHERKLLGNDLQRNPVDLPGLWGHPQFRKRLMAVGPASRSVEIAACGGRLGTGE